jgi:sterol 3beta-glucosyltransferase
LTLAPLQILKQFRSSALIPKPPDWGTYINISGFSFLKTGSDYEPPPDLVQFLNAGPPPIYIGFGSIVVEKPEDLTKLIFGAVKRTGVRALVSKGWGGLGEGETPKDIFLLGNCPHDWLFKYVSCVIHHGGAGTTAIGIAMGKPTIVIPFFGDQPFWGAMVHRAGAGPAPVAYKNLTEEKLAESIKRALEPDIQSSVKKMSEKIAGEDGSAAAAMSFFSALKYDDMRCLFCPDRVATWYLKKMHLRLSDLACATLTDNGLIDLRDVKLYSLLSLSLCVQELTALEYATATGTSMKGQWPRSQVS